MGREGEWRHWSEEEEWVGVEEGEREREREKSSMHLKDK